MTDAKQTANRWADLRDSDDEVPTHDDAMPPAGAKPAADAAAATSPEVANAGADADDGFEPVRVAKPRLHQRARRADAQRRARRADAQLRAAFVRLLKRVTRPDGFLIWKDWIATFPRHVGTPLPNQMPAKTLEELEAVVEALVDDGILKRRKRHAPGSCAFLTTKLVDDALKAQDARRQGAAAAKQFRQRKAASAQRARQQGAKAKAKAKAKADADAHARLVAAATVDPVFVSEEAMPRDYGPVGAAAPAAVPQVQYVPVVVTQQGLMAVMPYGAVPLVNTYVAY